MDGFLLDVRSAWRAAWRRPALTALTILTLVLGIGANTAIFAVARGVLLRPLPYQDPESVAMIWRTAANAAEPRGIATPEMVREYRARATSFADIAAVELWQGSLSAQVDLLTNDGAERLRGSFVTPNFFSLLGANAAVGRVFGDGDGRESVVLSDGLWRRRFAGDPAIVGQTIDIAAGRLRTRVRAQVIGVLPPRFRFTYPEDTEIWIALPFADVAQATPQALLYRVVARLKPGVSVEAANSEMAAVVASMQSAFPKSYDRMQAWVEPVHEWSLGRVRPAVRLVGGVTLLLLVIACLNVASLLVAQGIPWPVDSATAYRVGNVHVGRGRRGACGRGAAAAGRSRGTAIPDAEGGRDWHRPADRCVDDCHRRRHVGVGWSAPQLASYPR
jgi:putative ABC transport system permease protein